jgi:hypothetical protein
MIADRLMSQVFWQTMVGDCEVSSSAGSDGTARIFRELVSTGSMVAVAERVACGAYEPALPRQLTVRSGAKERTLYVFPPTDHLLMRGINRVLQETTAGDLSPLCHSFRPGRGIKTAFFSLIEDASIDEKACLSLDVVDYNNSIDVIALLESLPLLIAEDTAMVHLLRTVLLRKEVVRGNRVVEVAQKGVMAGTPLAPLLSNLYLTDLDATFARAGVTYARYADDIILFAPDPDIHEHHRNIRAFLAAKQLQVNEQKTSLVAPGEPWEFLGLRYYRGRIDLSARTSSKLQRKVHNLARQLNTDRRRRDLSIDEVTAMFVMVLNRKLYGLPPTRHEFNWTAGFFPVLNSSATLKTLDRFVQTQIRYAVCGDPRSRNHKLLPYKRLQAMGYVPLTAAFDAFKSGRSDYAGFMARRTGSTPPISAA